MAPCGAPPVGTKDQRSARPPSDSESLELAFRPKTAEDSRDFVMI